MEYSLEIKGLTKHFESGFSLNNIDLAVPKGSVVGFIGENGAGKTTTLKCALGILRHDSGTIRLFGKSPEESSVQMKEDIGVVFDESCFHETLTAKNLDRIFRGIYKQWDTGLYERYLKQFQLPKDRILKEYSRGMKMKLSIAAALSHHPKLLLLDEATSGLDPVVRDEILEIFYDFIGDEEHSILMSSHITSDLEKIADYITFIHKGKQLLSAPKDSLLDHYGILKCSRSRFETVEAGDIVRYREGEFGIEALVSDKDAVRRKYQNLVLDHANLEEIMVFYVKGEQK